MINEEIDRLRHNATQVLLTRKGRHHLRLGFLHLWPWRPGRLSPERHPDQGGGRREPGRRHRQIAQMQFTRLMNTDLVRGSFRVTGAVLEIMPANEEKVYRIEAPCG